MRVKILSLVAACLALAAGDGSNLYFDEVRSLSELPLDRLIRIKSSLAAGNDAAGESLEPDRKLSASLPLALPLKRSSKKPMRRHGEYEDDKGKDTKISKIFQLAVTALSFLAFGGYLMTLIITAIKRSNASNGNANVIVFSNLQKYHRPKRSFLVLDPAENDFDTDRLYQGMIMLSRSYAQYN